MIEALCCLMLAVGICAQNPGVKNVALIYCGGIIFHSFLFGELDNELYYLSAATTDWLVLLVVSAAAGGRIAFEFLLVSLASIVGNFAGCLLWFFYLKPFLYDSYFLVLNIYALALLIKSAGGVDVGIFALARNCHGFCIYHGARIVSYCRG